MSVLNKQELKLVAAFALAGVVIPFAVVYPLWWRATRDQPIITQEHSFEIRSVLFPGERGVFLGLTGPRPALHVIVMMWMEALAQNVAFYVVAGIAVVLILRLAKSQFSRT